MFNQFWFTEGFSIVAQKHCETCLICISRNTGRPVKMTATAAHPPPTRPFEHVMVHFFELTPICRKEVFPGHGGHVQMCHPSVPLLTQHLNHRQWRVWLLRLRTPVLCSLAILLIITCCVFFVRHCVQKMLVTTLSQYPSDPPTEDQFVPEFLRDRDSDSDSDDAGASDISA